MITRRENSRNDCDGKGNEDVVELKVKFVGMDRGSGHRVVILEEANGERYLSIAIGPAEAQAIGEHLKGGTSSRLSTHQLVHAVIDRLGGRTKRAIISGIQSDTLLAAIELEGPEDPGTVECRPSDAIAVAMRAGAPIFIRKMVADQVMRHLRGPRMPEGPPPAG